MESGKFSLTEGAWPNFPLPAIVWRPCSAAPASSAATSCAPSPRRAGGCAWRCAGPISPASCEPTASSGRCEPVQANVRYPASVEAAVEGAEVVVNASGMQRETGRQSFDAVHAAGVAGDRRRGQGRRRPRSGAYFRPRRRRRLGKPLYREQGARRGRSPSRLPRGFDPAPVGGVRRRGQVLQPLRRTRARAAGAAGVRGRHGEAAAGLCRRRRARRRLGARRRPEAGDDLRTRRPRDDDADRGDERGDARRRAPPPHRAAAARAVASVGAGDGNRQRGVAGLFPGDVDDDPRSGRPAAQRQCRQRRGRSPRAALLPASASSRVAPRRSCRFISRAIARPGSSLPIALHERRPFRRVAERDMGGAGKQ